MRFLADECCDFVLAKALRAAGHDVRTTREVCPGAEDSFVGDLAVREKRILLTEDKDFGQLVFAQGRGMVGIVFLRYPHECRDRVSRTLTELVRTMRERLAGSFVTVQPGRIRIGRIPGG